MKANDAPMGTAIDAGNPTLSPTGRHVVGFKNGTAQLTEIRTGTTTTLDMPSEPSPSPQAYDFDFVATWSPNGRYFVVGHQFLFDVEAPTSAMNLGQTTKVAIFSGRSNWVVTGTTSGTRLSSLPQGAGSDIDISFGPPMLAAFSNDEGRIAILSEARELRLFERETRKLLASLAVRVAPRSIAFTPDGEGIVIATDRWVHLYRLSQGELAIQASRRLDGSWSDAFSFLKDDGSVLQIITGVSDHYLRKEVINFTTTNAPPLEGDPRALIQEWSRKLGVALSNDEIAPVGVIAAPHSNGSDRGDTNDAAGGKPDPNKPRGSSERAPQPVQGAGIW
jgi:hypothetical protein